MRQVSRKYKQILQRQLQN